MTPKKLAAEKRAEAIRLSPEYLALTTDEKSVLEHMPVYSWAAYIRQLLAAHSLEADAACARVLGEEISK